MSAKGRTTKKAKTSTFASQTVLTLTGPRLNESTRGRGRIADAEKNRKQETNAKKGQGRRTVPAENIAVVLREDGLRASSTFQKAEQDDAPPDREKGGVLPNLLLQLIPKERLHATSSFAAAAASTDPRRPSSL